MYNNYLFTEFLYSLTIDTGLKIKDKMIIKDVYGNPHDFTKQQMDVMIGIGWACFLGSWIVNIAYYKFHPSAVEMFSFSDKKILWVFGRDVFSWEESNKKTPADVEGENKYWRKQFYT